MPLVNVMVNGRAYTIACDDGEEDHLRELAQMVDTKAKEVLGSVGQVGDSRLILMAALLIADENHALTARLSSTGDQEVPPGRQAEADNAAAEALEAAAARIEDIEARLVEA